ncbi:hypothetical protein COO60DRAFT_944549 [Scenedesmus sp. NREL 46B-D3]|nr:hypothetical protein COO60DRAFT_944549 [Scenedesmus sp. NREL 46B-D3]
MQQGAATGVFVQSILHCCFCCSGDGDDTGVLGRRCCWCSAPRLCCCHLWQESPTTSSSTGLTHLVGVHAAGWMGASSLRASWWLLACCITECAPCRLSSSAMSHSTAQTDAVTHTSCSCILITTALTKFARHDSQPCPDSSSRKPAAAHQKQAASHTCPCLSGLRVGKTSGNTHLVDHHLHEHSLCSAYTARIFCRASVSLNL